MSTAMERVMRERGDLWCAHEPFMYDYYVNRRAGVMPHFDVQPDHPVTYGDIRDMLLARAENGPVFFKDMAYYVAPQVLQDPEFAARLTHCFLIRNPVASILSYHKLDPGLSREEIGIEAQWQLYSGLRDAGHAPVVIEAEAVRVDTRAALTALWRQIGLPYSDKAFDWQNETPGDWQQVGSWHGAVTASSGIRPADIDEPARKLAEFKEQAQHAPQLQKYLDHHLPFYQRLRAKALVI